MTAFRKILPFAGALALIGMALPAAEAQSAKHSATAKSSALAANSGKWTCVSRQTVEIAPVSSDVRSNADSWVVVYRAKGEIIASQRVSGHEIEQIKRMPCGGPDSELGGVAIG